MDYSRAVRASRNTISDETQADRTVTITADSDVKVLDILQTLLAKVGPETLAGVQPRGQGLYDVAFYTDAAYREALDWNLPADGSCLKTISPADGLTRIRVLATPMHWKWSPLLDALGDFGEVSQYYYETYRGHPTIRNGTRVVLLKLKDGKTLNDTIRVENVNVRLDFPGVVKSCFYCHETGHMVRDCPKKTEKTVKTGPSSSAAPRTPEVEVEVPTPSTSGTPVPETPTMDPAPDPCTGGEMDNTSNPKEVEYFSSNDSISSDDSTTLVIQTSPPVSPAKSSTRLQTPQKLPQSLSLLSSLRNTVARNSTSTKRLNTNPTGPSNTPKAPKKNKTDNTRR